MTGEGRQAASDVPWQQIVGMRHILVHVYWGIDLHQPVKTVREDLPGFIAVINRVLGPETKTRTPRRPRKKKSD